MKSNHSISMTFNLTRKGIAIPLGSIPNIELIKLRKKLIVMSKGFKNKVMTMQAYHVDKRTTYLARMQGIIELNKLGYSIKNMINEGDELSADISLAPLILKDYQEQIYNFISEKVYSNGALKLGMTSCILNLQPGRGKTFIAMALIQYISKRTLFIVPGIDLQRDTVKVLKSIFTMLKIGSYNGASKTDGDIVVMSVASALSDSFTLGDKQVTPEEYFDRFGFTIFDEIHMYCTRERADIFARCASLFSLGISGTCFHRQDKMDPIAHYHIGYPICGEKLVKINNIQPIVDWKFKAICIKYNGPLEYTQSLMSEAGTISHPLMINQFSKDPYRSQIIINIIKSLVANKDKIFVMLDRTELVKLAYDYLMTVALDVAMITGKVKEAERAVARKSSVVLGTYACIGTGISWDEFNAIVFWHPRKSNFAQYINRIFRENGDRSIERKAYFIQDNATSIKSQYYGFRSVCIELRDTKPIVEEYNWKNITPSEEVKKIAADYTAWDLSE